MKYGKLFREYIKDYVEDYAHMPSTNRCSTLPYKELKLIAKTLYKDVKEDCERWKNVNPLFNYTRMPADTLAKAVYKALKYRYNY